MPEVSMERRRVVVLMAIVSQVFSSKSIILRAMQLTIIIIKKKKKNARIIGCPIGLGISRRQRLFVGCFPSAYLCIHGSLFEPPFFNMAAAAESTTRFNVEGKFCSGSGRIAFRHTIMRMFLDYSPINEVLLGI